MGFVAIESSSNTKFKSWKKLLDSKGIQKTNRFLLFGQKIISETLAKHPKSIGELIHPSEDVAHDLWAKSPNAKNVPRQFILPKRLFDLLDVFGINDSVAVLNVPQIPQWNLDDEFSGMELFLPLGDPSNLGAVLRSCRGFGVEKIVLLKEAANPFHPKCLRAASDAVFDLPLAYGPSIKELPQEIFSLSMEGESLNEFEWPQSIKLLLGEEGPGLPEEMRLKNTLRIPISVDMESLNATVAASIALYSYRQKFPLK